MEQLTKIRELVQPILAEQNLRLAECRWVNESRMHILQIAIMRPDGSMDLDTCALISSQLSEILDATEVISQEYYLEVCSPGAERVLTSEEDIQLSVGKDVYVRFHHPISKLLEVTGTLSAYDGQTGTIEYREKTAKKSLSFLRDNLDYIRLAVRL